MYFTALRIVIAIGCCSVSGCAWSAEPLSLEACVALIEQLANPDKPPFSKKHANFLPKGVAESSLEKSQRPMREAYNALSDNIEVALPLLVKHCKDERFSCVYEDKISGTFNRLSVADACRAILTAHVDVFQQAVAKPSDGEGRKYRMRFDYPPTGDFDKWWEDRKTSSLADLQLERIEWAANQPQPEYFTAGEWTAARKSLQKMADEIKQSKRPLPVKHTLTFFSK
jgi:hypothetical protein